MQEFQRFQPVDLQMAGDVEATLPSLIEAVKSALTPERKAAIDRKIETNKKLDALEQEIKKLQAPPAEEPDAKAASKKAAPKKAVKKKK